MICGLHALPCRALKAWAKFTIADFHAAALGSGVRVEEEVKVALLLKTQVGKY